MKTMTSNTSRSSTALVLALCLFLSSLVHEVYAASPDDWRGRQIYQIVTDRFAVTDGSTTTPCNTTDQVYCGGTFQGVIARLDYIQGMGFDAIWISPVVQNINQTDPAAGEAYHGFWSQDITRINDHFGSPTDLQALSSALHSRGMYLMVDVVANNFAYPGPGQDTVYTNFVPFNSIDYFHPFCYISNYSNYTNAQQCWLGDDSMSLPDMKSELPFVQAYWNQWGAEMVQNYSIDGFRIDAAKHVYAPFWNSFQASVNIYTVGEALDSNAGYVCTFMSQALSGVLNYPLWYNLTATFSDSSANMEDLQTETTYISEVCQDPTLMGVFTENQDQPRFASKTQDLALQKNALAYSLMTDGIPIVYYGAEQAFNSTGDPENREALWLSNYDTSAPMYIMIAAINAARNAIAANADFSYWSSYWTFKSKIVYVDPNVMVIRKGYAFSLLAFVTNKASSAPLLGPYTIGDTNFLEGEQIMEVLTCQTLIVGQYGVINVTMPAGGEPMVWAPVGIMLNSTLCPSVIKNYSPLKITPPVISGASLTLPARSAVAALSCLLLAVATLL